MHLKTGNATRTELRKGSAQKKTKQKKTMQGFAEKKVTSMRIKPQRKHRLLSTLPIWQQSEVNKQSTLRVIKKKEKKVDAPNSGNDGNVN